MHFIIFLLLEFLEENRFFKISTFDTQNLFVFGGRIYLDGNIDFRPVFVHLAYHRLKQTKAIESSYFSLAYLDKLFSE